MKTLCGIGLVATLLGAFQAQAAELNVLCTTFPVHHITRNLLQGREGVRVRLMLPASMGCPHNYVLTPQDMQSLADASVLIINGRGMEDFLRSALAKANPDVVVVDSSLGIEEPPAGHAAQDHDHEEANPHLFVSPRLRALMAANIAAGLGKVDPEGAAHYVRQAKAYAERMHQLAQELGELGRTLVNRRIVTQHNVFDCLARDMGLEVVAVLQAHPGQDPSAADMLNLVRLIREKKAGALFTEPQYSDRVGQSISREAGIPMAVLDPVATGPENAPLDHYETVMRKNVETLRATLGVRE